MRKFFHSIGMVADPVHKNLNDFVDLSLGESASGKNAMPLAKTFPAAASRSVLSDETWMAAHRSLAAVMKGLSGSKPFLNEIAALQFRDLESVFRKEPELGFSQFETRPEF